MMMLNAIGIDVPYRRLLSILEIQSWGTAHRNIQLLERLRLDIQIDYQQGVLDDLRAALNAGYPPAVFLQAGELPYWHARTRHAVVLVGYDDDSFYVNDPYFEHAPQVVSFGDLDLAWSEAEEVYAVITRKR
jgi:hypothetical protein